MYLLSTFTFAPISGVKMCLMGGVVMQITVVKEQKEQSVKPLGGSQNGNEQKRA